MREVKQLAEQETRYSINSPLLFGVLSALDPETRFNVLDLSPANPELVEYFSGYRCKLVLPGCRDELLDLKPDEEDASKPTIETEINASLPSRAAGELPLNLILLWDLPNFLDKRVLRALAAQLAERCDHNTVLHTYIHTRQNMPDQPADYRLMPDNHILVDIAGTWNTPCPMYYQEMLHKLLAPFRIVRGMLLSNGLQEYILRPARPAA